METHQEQQLENPSDNESESESEIADNLTIQNLTIQEQISELMKNLKQSHQLFINARDSLENLSFIDIQQKIKEQIRNSNVQQFNDENIIPEEFYNKPENMQTFVKNLSDKIQQRIDSSSSSSSSSHSSIITNNQCDDSKMDVDGGSKAEVENTIEIEDNNGGNYSSVSSSSSPSAITELNQFYHIANQLQNGIKQMDINHMNLQELNQKIIKAIRKTNENSMRIQEKLMNL